MGEQLRNWIWRLIRKGVINGKWNNTFIPYELSLANIWLYYALFIWYFTKAPHSYYICSVYSEVSGSKILFFFYIRKFYKHKKHKNVKQPNKNKKGNIFYAHKKHLREKKSLVCAFCVFYDFFFLRCFLWA